MLETKQFARRLLSWVLVLNLAGLVCLWTATDTRDPLTWQSADASGDIHAALLGSIGFTLTLPGSFFAAAVFLCARMLVHDDRAARAIWYGAAVLINLFIARKLGAAYKAARS